MKAAILYNKFYDYSGVNITVGGIQTYISNLARVCMDLGMETTVYQFSGVPFDNNADGVAVRGVPVLDKPHGKRNRHLYDTAVRDMDVNKDIIVFAADYMSVPTDNPRHIAIQHGVSWDLPIEYMTDIAAIRYSIAARLKKWREIRMYKQIFNKCKNTVCVDYNFMNWYRTTQTEEVRGHNIWVIPNFSPIAPKELVNSRTYSNRTIRIIFARRFVKMRGTRIIGEAAQYLLGKHRDVCFTFAGEGPEETWLKEMFGSENRVSFIKYMPEDSLDIHLTHDIAVVPSIASEGTSLSVAEAMATGCPVVATATGGVTNMIIQGYNGVLVMPDAASLIAGLEMLILDSGLRERIGLKGYDTAKEAFSLPRWKSSWQEVLKKVIQ